MTIFETDPNVFERELRDFDHPPEEPMDSIAELGASQRMEHPEALGQIALTPDQEILSPDDEQKRRNSAEISAFLEEEKRDREERLKARVGEGAYSQRKKEERRAWAELAQPGGLGTDFSPTTNTIVSPKFDEEGNQQPGGVIIHRANTVSSRSGLKK